MPRAPRRARKRRGNRFRLYWCTLKGSLGATTGQRHSNGCQLKSSCIDELRSVSSRKCLVWGKCHPCPFSFTMSTPSLLPDRAKSLALGCMQAGLNQTLPKNRVGLIWTLAARNSPPARYRHDPHIVDMTSVLRHRCRDIGLETSCTSRYRGRCHAGLGRMTMTPRWSHGRVHSKTESFICRNDLTKTCGTSSASQTDKMCPEHWRAVILGM